MSTVTMLRKTRHENYDDKICTFVFLFTKVAIFIQHYRLLISEFPVPRIRR